MAVDFAMRVTMPNANLTVSRSFDPSCPIGTHPLAIWFDDTNDHDDNEVVHVNGCLAAGCPFHFLSHLSHQ